jgi:hypothetical protein
MHVPARAQDGPGRYNEEVWQALDRVLEEARRAGLKVILSFLDNWKYLGAASPSLPPLPAAWNALTCAHPCTNAHGPGC